MTTLPKISLNEKWRYHNTADAQNYAAVNVDDSDWEWTLFTELPISSIPASTTVWLRNRFDLLQTEECVSYFLRCDYCAFPMKCYLRGKLIADVPARAALDFEITDFVTLDDNLLVVSIQADAKLVEAQTNELYLQPIFCQELG